MSAKQKAEEAKQSKLYPFRAAVFRGLAVLLPPLLTIVIFLWVGGTIERYVLTPVSRGARDLLVWSISDIRKIEDFPASEQKSISPALNGKKYVELENGAFVPSKAVYETVAADASDSETEIPKTGTGIYQRYVELRYLKPYVVVPFFLSVFILAVYLLGKFMAAGLGRMLWNLFESGIRRVPLVRNVYSSVKQVSDFLLSERDFEYSRVVAVEWPRKGIWSLGLVTGDSMQDIASAANEPVLSVLICTSPMPMTGFTVTVRKSEAVDLDITIDQAFQFIVSCGVVVPPHQVCEMQSDPDDKRPLIAAGESTDLSPAE